MRLPLDKAVNILKLLLDGMSIRACERFTGVCHKTICDMILSVGERCRDFMAERLQGVPVADVQVDEIWSWVGKKEKTKNTRRLRWVWLGPRVDNKKTE